MATYVQGVILDTQVTNKGKEGCKLREGNIRSAMLVQQ